MAFPFRKIVVIGATSGIGKALADRFVQNGISVVAVGRRQDRLDAFVQEHGSDKASSMNFDVSNSSQILSFVQQVMKEHPEADSVLLNQGIQRQHHFTQPEKVNLESVKEEMNVNFISNVELTQAFLPYLSEQKGPTSLMFTTSGLAYIPAFPMPIYSASKAALSAFILSLRFQLRNSSTKVIEIAPPAVQTELHDFEMGKEAGRQIGMPLDAFTDQAWQGLSEGKDQVVVGSIANESEYYEIVKKRRDQFEFLSGIFAKHFEKS